MEEAEVPADRIAVIVSGRIVASVEPLDSDPDHRPRSHAPEIYLALTGSTETENP
jgi:hypothetical protein